MLFVVAPGVWYEVAVRNDFIANLLLVGAFVNWLSSRITTVWLTGHAIVLGIVAGLFASTRLVTLIPLEHLLHTTQFVPRHKLIQTGYALAFQRTNGL